MKGFPLIVAALAVALLAGTHHVQPKPGEPLAKDLFAAKKTGTEGKPKVYGYYSKGCMAGAVQLQETGPTWQAMRLSRNRNWGQPDLVDFIKELSLVAVQQVQVLIHQAGSDFGSEGRAGFITLQVFVIHQVTRANGAVVGVDIL